MAGLDLSSMIPNISAQSLITSVLYGLIGLVLLTGVIAFLVLYFMNKRYSQYEIEIYEKDSMGNIFRKYDKAGIFLDKRTKFRLLFLKGAKVGMNPNNIPHVNSIDGKGKVHKIVQLLKTGVRNYRFIKLKIENDNLINTVGEEDLNAAEQDWAKILETYSKPSWLEKFGGFAMFGLAMIIIFILVLYIFTKFSILDDTSKNLMSVSSSQHETTGLLVNVTQALSNITQTLANTQIIKTQVVPVNVPPIIGK